MKSYAISSVSKSANGKTAQVTIPFGTGQSRRSVTRHIRFVAGKWIGFNPDERAVPLNERYEAELRKAKIDLADAETALKKLRGQLQEEENLSSEEKLQLYINQSDDASEMVKKMLYAAIQDAEEVRDVAADMVDDAGTKLTIVQRDLPLNVEFFGVGLTY